MQKEQYIDIFIEETKEHVENLSMSLLQLEKNSEDEATINEIFRSAHTLKGLSGAMGFDYMSSVTHKMEDVLDLIRTNRIKASSKVIDMLFKCLDILEEYLDNIINTGDEGKNEYKEIIDSLTKLISDAETLNGSKPPSNVTHSKDIKNKKKFLKPDEYENNVINKAFNMGMNVFQINFKLDSGCMLKSARVFIIFQLLEKHSEIIKSEPAVEELEDENFDLEFSVIVVTDKDKELLINALNTISEIDKVEIEYFEAQHKFIEEKDAHFKEDANINPDFIERSLKDVVVTKNKITATKTVRVDIERLDLLMNLVSELIIQKTRLAGIPSLKEFQEFNETLEYLERITTQLHDAVMKVRMVPIDKVFNRFPRMIRDISRELNKDIILQISGEETELDRTVIDEIGDPLIHILRNAADHGIESTEERRRKGKSEEGHIWLKAYQAGNSVVIDIEDDGRGFDIDEIRKKGIEKGLINSEIAKNLTQEELTNLVFLPGFSTANVISDISGRGVGLDVVKTQIESMGGTIEIRTEKDKGTKFVINLPLTLAIIQALLVKVGQEKYAIPINATSQIIEVKASEIKTIQKKEVVVLRDAVIPIIRLEEVLRVPKENYEKKNFVIVTVKKGEKLSGFMVDEVLGQQEIVIKPLGNLLKGIKYIAGATILGDGNLALILDVNSLA